MKNIFIYAVTALSFLIVGCEESLNDVYKDLDIDPDSELINVVEDFEYTLSEADYTTAGQSYPNFSSEEDAKEGISTVLSSNFGYLANNSSALVHYDLYRGGLVDSRVMDSLEYVATSEQVGRVGFFNEDYDAEDYILDFVDADVNNPKNGQVEIVTYKYANVSYADVGGDLFDSELFVNEDYLDDVNTQSVVGDQVWEWDEYGSETYAYISGYDGGAQPNEDWLVMPAIDLSGSEYSPYTLYIRQALNYLGDLSYDTDIAVKISSDYHGDVTTATWSTLTLDTWPAGNNWTFVNSEVDLSAFEGQTVNIAFFYSATSGSAPAWEISEYMVATGLPLETIETQIRTAYFQYSTGDGAWDVFYDMEEVDFAEMNFDSFSSSISPMDYVPTYLTRNYPYAQPGDEIYLAYDYNSSSSGFQVRGDHFTFSESGTWEVYGSVVSNELQFGLIEGEWIPDNTIKLDLGFDDWVWIADQWKERNPAGSESAAQYRNFDITLWTDQQRFEAITERLEELYPNTEEDQKYLVTYATWEPGAGSRSLYVIYKGGEYVEFEQ